MTLALRKPLLLILVSWLAWSPVGVWSQQPAPAPVSPPVAASDPHAKAEAWIEFGIANGRKGDLDGAIAAFNQALQFDPKSASAYVNRGFALSLQLKLDEAIADFTKALELDPKNRNAYYDRGVTRTKKGDFDGAIDDFTQEIGLDANDADACYNRGHARYFKGDLNGALADINRAIALTPNLPYGYLIRGLIYRAQGDEAGASVDFQKSANSGVIYGALWLWIVKSENGNRGIARENLSYYLNKSGQSSSDVWPAPIADFCLDQITQEAMMAKIPKGAQEKDDSCEALFFAGVAKRLSGDNQGALDCFHQAIATGSVFVEASVEARRETAQMQSP
jgi:lipoprotein NlpI